jgi:DNA-binding SARP family transcriptional activator
MSADITEVLGPASTEGVPSQSDPSVGYMRLTLLGGFALRIGTETLALPVSAQRVLAFVALHGSACLSRSLMAGSLWPDATEQHATGNLRTALWRLRRLGSPVVEMPTGRVQPARTLAIDYHDAVALARRLLDPAVIVDEAELEEGLLLSDVLVDWPDEWVILERERFRQLRLHALEALCERLTAVGKHGRSIEAGLAAIGADPLRESAHRTLIRAHLAEGNKAEAIQQYASCRRLLNDELGIEPSPQMKALVASSHLADD